MLVVPDEGEARDKAFPVVMKVRSFLKLFYYLFQRFYAFFPTFIISLMVYQQAFVSYVTTCDLYPLQIDQSF